jgi:hypothetical protein
VNPLWGIIEIAALAAMLLLGLWILGPRLADHPLLVVAYWLLVAAGGVSILWVSPVVLHADPPALRGWGRRRGDTPDPGSFRNAWRVYAAFTLVAATLLTSVAMLIDPMLTARLSWTALGIKFLGYLVFGVVQAFVFFGFVLTRVRGIIPVSSRPTSRWHHRFAVAAVTAVIFAGLHLPNLPLTALVLAAGFCWALIFYQHPNVLLLGISHAVLGTILHRVVQLYMRIGPFYSDVDGYVLRTVVPGVAQLIGDLF